MKFNIGERVYPSNDKVSPIYKGKLNEFGDDSEQKYVPRSSIGIIQGIRTRYLVQKMNIINIIVLF